MALIDGPTQESQCNYAGQRETGPSQPASHYNSCLECLITLPAVRTSLVEIASGQGATAERSILLPFHTVVLAQLSAARGRQQSAQEQPFADTSYTSP
jgi:hypothetical protein